jgi:hypothetical protein
MRHSGTPLAPHGGMRDDDEQRPTLDDTDRPTLDDTDRPTLDDTERRSVDDGEDATELPQREAMSLLVDPTALLGGGLVPSSPTAAGSATTPAPPSAATAGSDVPTLAGQIDLPSVAVPAADPDGSYQPETSSTSQT